MFNFKIQSKNGNARTGIFATPHGDIQTPIFMPVGTIGAVKTVAPWELHQLGAEIILGNTYHLMLRPGEKTIGKAGGLQKWTNWNGPMLTDSGGFQVFSLGNRLVKEGSAKSGFADIKPAQITDEGVTFYSHLDGSKYYLDATKSINIQQELGADIIMAFDECPSGSAPLEYIEKAVNRTHRWLDESISAWINRNNQALFGIVQGATNRSLRELSAKYINSKDLPGNAIGGVSVGESRADVWKAVEWSVPHLDPAKPRYLMGVGEPSDIVEAVKRGCDMFDCVLPTRLGRHGVVWVKGGGLASKKTKMINGDTFSYANIDLRKGRYAKASEPIDLGCQCPACKNQFSRSYLHHLVKEGEILGIRLTTLHNLHFVLDLAKELRKQID